MLAYDNGATPLPDDGSLPETLKDMVLAGEETAALRSPDLAASTARSLVQDLGGRIGSPVTLTGHLIGVRDFPRHMFLVVEDRSGRCQVFLPKERVSGPLKPGSFVQISGTVAPHPKLAGEFEVVAADIRIAAEPMRSVPLLLNSVPKETLEFQLDNRPISIRNPWVAAVFRVQAEVCRSFRTSLERQGFIEIHSSKIVAGGTEGGAEVFTVDYFGRQLTLTQSPQLYKQIAAGAFERVYEIGPVYRAENSNTSRHLTEFTGLDFELTYITDEHDVMDILEVCVRDIFDSVNDRCARQLELLGTSPSSIGTVPRLDYQEANKLVEELGTASKGKTLDKAIGDAVYQRYGSRVVFICGYPQNEKPFYIMPHEARPGVTRSFDLLIDGLEISSGGQRIHRYVDLISSMHRYKLRPENYEYYLQAFEYGMPPHGGCGLGLERLTQRLLNLSNVREATLFPRDVRRVSP